MWFRIAIFFNSDDDRVDDIANRGFLVENRSVQESRDFIQIAAFL
jgi:hypothetical protein